MPFAKYFSSSSEDRKRFSSPLMTQSAQTTISSSNHKAIGPSCRKIKWWALHISKLTNKCHSQTKPLSEWRWPWQGNSFSPLSWQENPQLWHRVLQPSFFLITNKYWYWAIARQNYMLGICKVTKTCHI